MCRDKLTPRTLFDTRDGTIALNPQTAITTVADGRYTPDVLRVHSPLECGYVFALVYLMLIELVSRFAG